MIHIFLSLLSVLVGKNLRELCKKRQFEKFRINFSNLSVAGFSIIYIWSYLWFFFSVLPLFGVFVPCMFFFLFDLKTVLCIPINDLIYGDWAGFSLPPERTFNLSGFDFTWALCRGRAFLFAPPPSWVTVYIMWCLTWSAFQFADP